MLRRPRACSRRRPDAVIDPSGNAIAAAVFRRSGAVLSGGLISSGSFDIRRVPNAGFSTTVAFPRAVRVCTGTTD